MHTRTSDLPPIEPSDPIWTVEHLAAALRQGERATRTLTGDASFPAGFRLNDSPNARRYWLREHVLDHFASLCATSAGPVPVPSQRRPADTDVLARTEIAALRANTGRIR
ncbi:hypothetical protein [Cellulomonas fengjieae]|uniref:Uncharacterized protein n=1 Tax=Cellulomonas fengjieae TaxID=2819978 RepID=A0ABS3SED7_9CELL|nr:hypothetical protein [Cellulomonas fengjieae]MBO3084123.1 hypothetical protein [Cellulomonas fengjieae]QVI64623.1 hypothetical protein KG102_10540 [Cellulomonas fengjieae]